MAEPKQKPGKSKQDYGTPSEFIAAVEARFGKLTFDLAAHVTNHVTPGWFGPGSAFAEDSLATPWWDIKGPLWLNPPFADIAPWAQKCAEQAPRGACILLLTPASIGSNWFAAHVHKKAYVLGLNPRMTFVGTSDPYPKDLMLSVFHLNVTPAFDVWRWKP